VTNPHPACAGGRRPLYREGIQPVEVELDYWTSRKRVEVEMARCASSPEARIVHQELARLYGDQAKQAETALLVGLVMAQAPADYVIGDPGYTTIGDEIAVALPGRAV
jgi:hypothetical protein